MMDEQILINIIVIMHDEEMDEAIGYDIDERFQKG